MGVDRADAIWTAAYAAAFVAAVDDRGSPRPLSERVEAVSAGECVVVANAARDKYLQHRWRSLGQEQKTPD